MTEGWRINYDKEHEFIKKWFMPLFSWAIVLFLITICAALLAVVSWWGSLLFLGVFWGWAGAILIPIKLSERKRR
jgi:fatty acid desaturase